MEIIDGQNRMEAMKRILAESKSRIAGMDESDFQNGRETPVSLSVQLGNVSAALHAAIHTQDWGAAADALVMLSQCNDPAKVRCVARFHTSVD